VKFVPTARTAGTLAIWRTVGSMSQRQAYRTMEAFFARQYRRNGRQVARLRATFAPIVEPDALERTVEEAFKWYGRYWADAFRSHRVSSAHMTRTMRSTGAEHLAAAVEDGTGAVLATMHLGDWDAGGRWVAERWPMTAVAEVLEPRRMYDQFLAYRRRLGMEIIPLEKGTDVTARCVEVVSRGELLALLCDRDLSGTGVEVRFFGRTAKMSRGPAVIAARSGCRILPAVIYQLEDGGHHVVVREPLPPTPDESPEAIAATMQLVANEYERFLRVAPAQWHMFQRFWPDDPDDGVA
jgi:KDO2-lipid IV(A) lauroyltransferase